MSMTHAGAEHTGADDIIAALDVETEIERVDVKAVAVLNRSEVEAQIDAAHRHPRQIKRFLNDAISLATISREVAESCIYTLPRGVDEDGNRKQITGPSVRLAEIAASCYGNLHYGSRVVDVGDKTITSQGVAWDIEKNLRVTIEVDRRITNRSGRKYNDDMIVVTGNAASAIAMRNAIFKVVPRAYIDVIYEKVRQLAVGNAATLTERRDEVIARLNKMGVPSERIFAKLGKSGKEDIGLNELEVLIGLGSSIKNGESQIDEVFPPMNPAPAAPTEDGRRISIRGGAKKVEPKADAEVPPHDPATGEVKS